MNTVQTELVNYEREFIQFLLYELNFELMWSVNLHNTDNSHH